MIVKNWGETAKLIKNNKIGVIPTDTIYGISCLALNKKLVEKVYEIKGREKNKPFIILLADINELKLFDINLSKEEKFVVRQYWPGPVSVIFKVNKDLSYLHRGLETLAFRLPSLPQLHNLLKITGPIISTSANISHNANATNINQAENYFKNKLDFYLDGGDILENPSKLIKIEDGKVTIIRR